MCPESMPTSKRQSKLRTMMFTDVSASKMRARFVIRHSVRGLANGAF